MTPDHTETELVHRIEGMKAKLAETDVQWPGRVAFERDLKFYENVLERLKRKVKG